MICKTFRALVGEDVKLALNGTTYDDVEWLDERPMPERSVFDAKLAEFEAEIPITELRAIRNNKLAETDWWASSDLAMTAEQTAYRQSLRDITNTYSSLDDVVWPEKP
jgi:hypothetical protein